MNMVHPSFSKIKEEIHNADAVAGFFFHKDPAVKKTRLEKFLSFSFVTHIVIFWVFIITTLILTHFKLINIIIATALSLVFSCMYISFLRVMWNKDPLIHLFDWCETLYDLSNLPSIVQDVARYRLLIIERRTLKILKWLKIILFIDGISATLGFAIVGYFLPDTIYPKFDPPIPLYLPFPEQRTWIAHLTTVSVQTFMALITINMCYYGYGIVLCIFIHIMGFLDIINDFVAKIKHEMQLYKVEENIKEPHKQSLDVRVLASINQVSVVPRKMPFGEWMEILTDMISNVNSNITLLNNYFTEVFLALELISICILFILGLVCTVIKQQQLFAIGLSLATLFLFLCCFINEKILETLNDIKTMLYDLPWYELEVKQRKILIILMNCDNIQQGFTAAGIHNLTVERFGIVVKAGYTNMLVLKDLIQK